uniref:RNA-dependent DNA polymerase n=1 Tax=Erythrocytic necrosis virus TaxID=1543320 RepID=A0A4D6QI63_9VIRU|nr:RNA-dependent DNA polymerase [Erythrocytic necrosis virus]QCF47492.1 RNA-dependent DNA polymerase [Erythrocytic necrosis virus]
MANLKNWRPLTLQSCDAKILAKCIALRIKRVLPGIVHPDQTGFLHGRYIGDNIQQLLEIIEHHETCKKPGMVFIAEFEKVFLFINDFISKCLDFFQFR